MAVEITGDSSTVLYNNTSDRKQTQYSRSDLSVSRTGNTFEMFSNNYLETFEFSDVTIPSTPNAEALLSAINDLI